MNRAGLRKSFLPGPMEADPAFRQELLRLSYRALILLGCIEIAFSGFFIERKWHAIPLACAGVFTVAAAIVPWSRKWPRAVAVLSVGLAAAALLWPILPASPELAGEERYVLPAIFSLFLAAVALVPLLPLETLLLGVAIGLFYLGSSVLVLQSWETSQQFFILLFALFATRVSALVFEQRRSSIESHREALRITADLNMAQSRAMLAETAVSVGRLAASLTHELNSPLGALQSAADTMLAIAGRQATAAPAEQTRLVEMQAHLHRSVRESAERLSQVIARLQQFTELENDEKRPADLNELIRNAGNLFQPKLDGRPDEHVRLEFDLQPLPPLSCNPTQLSAVISSLLSNAMNAIDGHGVIRVATAKVDSEIEIQVTDDGRGMNDGQVETLFDPGFKVTNGRVSAGNWSLFSSRQIVHEHGGDIRVESREGSGTTVHITLPCS